MVEDNNQGKSPLIFDIFDLRKSIGDTFEQDIRIKAPAEIGNPVIYVEENSPMNFKIELDSVVEGVFANFTIQAIAKGECSRCLDAIKRGIEINCSVLFEYEENPDDDEQYLVIDDTINLEPIVRDVVVTKLPFNPVCKDACLGLCSECGFRMEDDLEHHHEAIDSRWSALEGLINTNTTEKG
ncbi:MAG: YceD family protein [Micrococcaceae bacterium]